MTFDESNGSQVEQVDMNVVGKEMPPCEAIKHLSIGDVRPVEEQEEDEEQLLSSTLLKGPEVTDSAEVKDAEFLRKNTEFLRSRNSAPVSTKNQEDNQ
jgi:hypothetical protein